MKYWIFSVFAILLFSTAACRNGGDTAVPPTDLPDIHALQRRTFESLWTTINEQYVYEDFGGVNWQQIHDEYEKRLDVELTAADFTSFLEEMLAELPAGTTALQTREERIELAATDTSEYEGIGAFVAVRRQTNPRVILLSIMPDSPAELAGLQAHDSILAINGEAIPPDDGSSPVEKIRGPADTAVTLTVRSPQSGTHDVTVNRGRIGSSTPRIYWEMLDDGRTGYFLFPPGAYEEILNDFVLGLQALDARGSLDAIILDLRIVTLSQSWPAVSLLTLFIDGEMGEIYSRTETDPVPVPGVNDLANTQTIPLAVLISQDTNGPAEIFSATIQTYGRGIVVGSPSPGNVEALTPAWLPDGSRVSFASSSFRSVDGREIGLEGVTPDVIVAADWDEVTAVSDPVRDAALEALRDE